MTKENHQVKSELHRIEGIRTAVRLRYILSLPIAMAVWTTCATVNAQTNTPSSSHTQNPILTVMGSSGAGFQHWTAADLNSNGAPFWDAATLSVGNYSGNQDSKNVGFCLTGGGDCVGIGSQAAAPGALPYWGMTYDSVGDLNGALDPKVYFHLSDPDTFRASLELQISTVATELNEFGWFETDATGSTVGPRHILFQGSGVPPGSMTADPVGATVTFKPTPYFGYYFKDVSEDGCLAYTLYNFNDAAGCSTHPLVVFANNPSAPQPTFWIAAIDPPGCGDGDCNLTLVKIKPTK